LQAVYCHHSAAAGKTIVARTVAGDDRLRSDRTLLARVLANLLKNALEASRPGQVVTLAFHAGEVPTFTVHNESAMPASVQARMFERAFTTKGGAGRGVGLYSVKLLTESYLEGTVEFRSTEKDGTTFTVRLPQANSQT
jgi:signal transduction histidine kinase